MNRDELIEKMSQAFQSAYHNGGPLSDAHPRGMAAALDVVLGEVLTDDWDELDPGLTEAVNSWNWEIIKSDQAPWRVKQMLRDAICIWRGKRRAKYQKVKTAEERVTVELCRTHSCTPNGPCNCEHRYDVLRDGLRRFSGDKDDCEIYRLGLIAQLKEGK